MSFLTRKENIERQKNPIPAAGGLNLDEIDKSIDKSTKPLPLDDEEAMREELELISKALQETPITTLD